MASNSSWAEAIKARVGKTGRLTAQPLLAPASGDETSDLAETQTCDTDSNPITSTGANDRGSVTDQVKAAIAKGKKERGEDAKSARVSAEQLAKDAINKGGSVAIDQHGRGVWSRPSPEGLRSFLLNSQSARNQIQLIVAEAEGKALSRDRMQALVDLTRAAAERDKRYVHAFTRVGYEETAGGMVYCVDLGAGSVARISKSGWGVAPNHHMVFLGCGGEIPTPVEPQNAQHAWEILTEFFNALGIEQKSHLLLATVLCEMLRADTPYPILDIVGPAGGGKTTVAREISAIIDPTTSGELPEAKPEEPDLAALAVTNHLFVIDNAGKLDRSAQNVLCKVAYGYQYTARKLYEQETTVQLPIKNPIIITSVIPAITAPDLQSRSIRLNVKPRNQYTSQSELRRQFEARRGEIVGALYTILAAGLANE